MTFRTNRELREEFDGTEEARRTTKPAAASRPVTASGLDRFVTAACTDVAATQRWLEAQDTEPVKAAA